jgi:small-conductance mechanosensitive channel
VVLGATVALALFVRWVAGRQAARVIVRLPGDEAAIRTRWRTLSQIATAAILVVGIAIALSNFEVTSNLGRAALASGAVLAVVIGFAAQSTLANVVSGVLLAFSQPIRIGDRVTIQGYSGEIEEIGLTYTYVIADDGRRVIFPNSIISQTTIENATIRGASSRALVRVPVRLPADLTAARDRLLELAAEAGLSQPTVAVAELSADSAVLEVRGRTSAWREARASEERLRLAAAGEVHEAAT